MAMNASYVHTSLALRTLSEALRAGGFEVTALEYTIKDSRTRILEELYACQSDVYGFSCYIWNINELLPLAEELKRLKPRAKIVLGGPEVSFWTPDELSLYPFVDFLVTGEGEDALPALCRDIENGVADVKYPDKTVEGGAFAGFEEQGIPYTDREITEGRIVYYESSRGCPFRCAYCLSSVTSYGSGQKRVRAKSAERTLRDLLRFESPGSSIKVVKFVDRTFNFDRERAKTIWRGLLGDGYTKSYHFEVCASLLDEESLEILSRAPDGKFQLEIGVQSTSSEALLACDRPDDTERVLDMLAKLRGIPGVHVHADLIAGLPFESYERFGESFDAVFGLCDQLQVGFLKLLNGCKLRLEADRHGYVFGLLGDGYTKSYHFEVCASLLDEESLEILSRAPDGKFQLEIGVQSTSSEALLACDRPDDTERVLDMLAKLRGIPGVHVHADLIAGLPFESYERFGESFDAVFGLCDQLQVGFLKLLNGCKLRLEADRHGYVFSPRPPYEVLKNNYIDFPDLCRLKRIAALVDRLVSSGRFDKSLDFIIKATVKSHSAFEFFEGLDAYLGREVSTISGRALYEEVFALALSRVEDFSVLREILHRLHYDYLSGETSPVPASMSVRCRAGLAPEYVTDKGEKKALLAAAAARGCILDAGATVAVRFCFADGVVLIDRGKRVVVEV